MANKQQIKLTPEQLLDLNKYKDDDECTIAELKRIQAILLLNSDYKTELILGLTGFKQKYAFELRKKFLKNGIDTLKDKKRPPKRLLTKEQQEEVLKIIKDDKPTQYDLQREHWTTLALARVIKQKFNVVFKSRTPLYLLFQEAKFSYHKPEVQYKKRNQEVINQWKVTYKPIIEKLLQDENTVVLAEDEMMLTTQTTTQKVWLPRGQTPKIDVAANRKLRCIYGFLNVATGKEHAFKANGANSEETCKALNAIADAYQGKNIVVMWDNASWHKSEIMKAFLKSTKHSFFLLNFPPYAPELNPQEHVWKAGRVNVTHNRFLENIDTATDEFVSFLNNKVFEYGFL